MLIKDRGLKRSLQRLSENVNDARAARSRLRWAFAELLHHDIFQRELTKRQRKEIEHLRKTGLQNAHTAVDRAKIAFRVLYRIFNQPKIKAQISKKDYENFMTRYTANISGVVWSYQQKSDWFLNHIATHLQTLVTSLKLHD